MNHTRYHPFNPDLYSGRDEPFESDRACYWHELMHTYTDQKIGLVGFACDQGVRRNQGRVGAKTAPDLIRQALARLPCSVALLDHYGTDRTAALARLIGDAGSIECVDNDQWQANALEATQQAYADTITTVLDRGGLAIGLGGGHAIAYASFLGLWQSLSDADKAGQRIGVVNFDAHLDIRQSDVATSGTPFRQIAEHLQASHRPFHYLCIGVSEYSNTAALFDRAETLGIQMISDNDCYRQPFERIAQTLDAFGQQVDILYLTIDMDCFAAGLVPGVSATAAKGLTLDFVERCIDRLMATGKVKVADLAEINPGFDRDGISSKVAARLLADIGNHHLLQEITV
ncbi:MAG: formimidoylglutamase [Gammaproteobacteria bacterium]|nr:MAG: formimidoylglutamase [Pseudomonadota bacterium]PIE38562.1 MAG: formimidoylglutamase [Gammaproteobacteria bacterium]